ncbi:MAG: orotate phosphoribosyltransferase [Parcubacteria group bacterium]|nr:orotate phosphoribosyltransferase [Parcubacteria group bacterium]
MNKKELILKLAEINAIKFGEFTLKSGMKSPIYVDLRVIVSYPEVMKMIAKTIEEKIKENNLEYDIITGPPYNALPIASVLSVDMNIPMIYMRKELKGYGTNKKIEGLYKKGQTCLVIDDLITTGGSKFEAIEPLEKEGVEVKDVVVLVDREQGGKKKLKEKGYNLYSIILISEMLDVLKEENKIDNETYEKVNDFLKANQV